MPLFRARLTVGRVVAARRAMPRTAVLIVFVMSLSMLPSRASGQSPPSCGPVGATPSRVALVLGNAAYRSSPALPNAANDARAVRDVLARCLGFQVILAQDLGRDGIVQKVREFESRVVPGGVAVFFYAGHGVEQDGRNYLIPTVHRIRTRADIPVEAYPIDDIVKRMEARTGESGVNIVIVDACRDNPLPAVAGEGRSFGWRSLAPVETQSGTLVMHSTRSGAQALDQVPGSQSRNSPFTTALIGQIVRPDITLRDLPYEVTAEVRRLTDRLQEPWSSASYVPAIRLAAAGGSVVSEQPRAGTRLRVTSSPTGAEITVGGRNVGRAPVEVTDLPAGEVTVRAQLGGHEPAESRIELRAQTSHEVQLILNPNVRTGRLFVETDPKTATVRLDGGRPYTPGMALPVGEYEIEVVAEGYVARRERVRVARAEEHLAIRLARSTDPAPHPAWAVQEVQGLPGAATTAALAVNASGVVLGVSHLGNGPQVGFIWSASGGLRPLDAIGGIGAVPSAINDAGAVAGTASDSRGEPRAVLWSADGRAREVAGLPAGQWTAATAINFSGDVAGTVVRPGAFSSPLGGRGAGQRAFLRRAQGSLRWLEGLGGETAPTGINASGQICGWSQDREGRSRAVVWQESGAARDLGTLGGAASAATAISDDGTVVGWAENGAGQKRAFRWTAAEGMHDLGTLGGQQAQAMAVNGRGAVVGTAHDASGKRRAFIWQVTGGMTEIAIDRARSAAAMGVAADGTVVGSFEGEDGIERAFIATSMH